MTPRRYQIAKSNAIATSLYCERNIVERFFNMIKHFRAIATRSEKTAQNFLAGFIWFTPSLGSNDDTP
jgi:hypothetical protein